MLFTFVICGIDFFEEIAKFRAMRRLWARTFNKRYTISDPNLLRYFMSCMTAGSSLTAQQPMNNIVRVAIEALAAVLGGIQVLYPCSMDEAYCTPTEKAVKVALRTQQIIANETGVKIDQIMPDSLDQALLAENNQLKYFDMPIYLEARSSYHNLGRFLSKIGRKDDIALRVGAFTIVATNDNRFHLVKLTFQATVYEELVP